MTTKDFVELIGKAAFWRDPQDPNICYINLSAVSNMIEEKNLNITEPYFYDKAKERISDIFLTEYFSKLSFDQLKLCKAYDNRINIHPRTKPIDDKFTEEQIREGFLLMADVYGLIAKKLFSNEDEHGFPDAKLFIDMYMKDYDYNTTIGQIASFYLKKNLAIRD